MLQPLLLRRTKDMKTADGQPILELPPRIETTVELDFSESERDFYSALYNRSKTQFEGFVKQGLVLNKYVQILTLLLRWLCSQLSRSGCAHSVPPARDCD